ncbi:MAG: PaaI family thioesterase [Archaeoglobaceae archaeon]|nr:PaaI family thioesterase [Archaeoglobaceae archaeon]MCX8151577.1 PaaI family thioesterase [Archaeoglobaceae archaeon]MDW8013145.1 PaaI family thioesterase [Archaeoglobaceae archaeon]
MKRDVSVVFSAPWHKLLGTKISEDSLELEVEEKHLQILGFVHGGVIASLLDTAIGLAINTTSDKIFVTSQLNVHYLKPVKSGKIVAKAKVLRIGEKSAVGYAEAYNNGELVAFATATFISYHEPTSHR